MDMFHSGKATTLVATDIAARGIHVDDVALVIHADPPAEHKAYLHRSGRTARAGAEGTVITLMTDDQVRDVRDLTRLAGIKPTTTKVHGPVTRCWSSSPPVSAARPAASSSRSPSAAAARPTAPTPSASAPQHRPDQRPVASGQPDRRLAEAPPAVSTGGGRWQRSASVVVPAAARARQGGQGGQSAGGGAAASRSATCRSLTGGGTRVHSASSFIASGRRCPAAPRVRPLLGLVPCTTGSDAPCGTSSRATSATPLPRFVAARSSRPSWSCRRGRPRRPAEPRARQPCSTPRPCCWPGSGRSARSPPAASTSAASPAASRTLRPVVAPLVLGLVLVAVFVAGSLVVREIHRPGRLRQLGAGVR